MDQNMPPNDPATITIVVYSKTGHSRLLGARIGGHLGVVPIEIATDRYTWPILGWIAAGRDGMRGMAAPLTGSIDLPRDGLVILVGPVWAGAPSAPMNTVVDALRGGSQDVAVALTCGDPKELPGPLEKVADRLGRALKAGLILSNAHDDTPDAEARIRAFIGSCTGQDLAA